MIPQLKITTTNSIENICEKENSKLRALARATPYMDIGKRKLLLIAFFNVQFIYCLLVWMLHNRCIDNKVKYLHEGCLRRLCNDKRFNKNFNKNTKKKLQQKDGSVSVLYNNAKELAIEMFKVRNAFAPKIIYIKNYYNVRNQSDFRRPVIKTVYMAVRASHLGPIIWDIIPKN